jgi:putative NADH-flavin reductase
MNKALVVGASGATGRLVVEQLLSKDVNVLAIVRQADALSGLATQHQSLQVVVGNVDEWTTSDFKHHLADCNIVISCLGHNLSFKGIFGAPRRLVTDTIDKIIKAITELAKPSKMRLILMNTSGNANRDIPERPALSQRIVIALLRYTLPPHVDNESAADLLRLELAQSHPYIEWVAVRPDALTDEESVSPYSVHPSPTRNAIFNSGASSRINVAHFMARLAIEDEPWEQWKGQMPVIYKA